MNGVAAGAGEALDPNFRPNVVDTFTLTFARQLNNHLSMEVGYIGRLIDNEYMGINLNAVPYMMTKGGQTFAKAYANLLSAVLWQAFRVWRAAVATAPANTPA